MKPLKDFQLPSPEGRFGAVRLHDIHTGIDLYCSPGDEVYAIETGTVVSIEPFTGDIAGSPWWNDTWAVSVKGKTGVAVYGEVKPLVAVGQTVSAGDVLATVLTVLKKDKGRPMTMLHLELYEGPMPHPVWELGDPCPQGLRNPLLLLGECDVASDGDKHRIAGVGEELKG